jgi:hypothetical protein
VDIDTSLLTHTDGSMSRWLLTRHDDPRVVGRGVGPDMQHDLWTVEARNPAHARLIVMAFARATHCDVLIVSIVSIERLT